MIGLDTDVPVRFLVDDQPGHQVARQFRSERTADSPAADGLVIECTEELDVPFSQTGPYGDLPDYLISWAAHRAGCGRTVTFDKAAAKRIPGMERLA